MYWIAEVGESLPTWSRADIRAACCWARDHGFQAIKGALWHASTTYPGRDVREPTVDQCQWLVLEGHEAGLDVGVTVTEPRDLDADVFPDWWKVGSYEMTYWKLLAALARCRSEGIHVSTGMATDREVQRAREVLPEALYYHCVSQYHTRPEDAALGRIRRLGLDGYSDHTGVPAVVVRAAALGATYCELHVLGDGRHHWDDIRTKMVMDWVGGAYDAETHADKDERRYRRRSNGVRGR